MSVTQYIGARYVPLFADPLAWDITQQYEPLTIVYYQGNSYTSKQAVPANIDISNTDYWAITGNYNAQIEQYRAEVQTYDNRITANTTSNTAQDAQLAGTTSSGLKTLIEGNASDIDNIESDISDLEDADDALSAQLAGSTSSGLKTLIETNASDIDDIETTLTGFNTTNQVKSYIDTAIDNVEDSLVKDMVVIGDSFTSSYYVNDANLWYHKVADFLNCTPHNYSQRGAGFLNASSQDSSTFMTLLNTAINDSTFDNANVKWVFVYGGLNDIDHANAEQAFSTYFNNFCNSVVNNFPNAKLVVCGINAWQTGLSFYNTGSAKRGQVYYEQLMKAASGFLNARGIFISMLGALGFNSSWYDSSNNHPNVEGHKAIASWIISTLCGNGLTRSFYGNIKTVDTTITATGNISYHFRPGLIEARLYTAPAQAGEPVIDELKLFNDDGMDLRGTILCMTSGSTNTFGWLGSHATGNNGINTTNAGFGRFVRAF